MKRVLVILVFLSIYLECFGTNNGSILLNEFYGCSNADSIPVKRAFRTLKINLFQVIFSEIPISYEIFTKPGRSLQFQVGYIFPRRNSLMNKAIFESMGEEGEATDEGLFSYRRSPFINDAGINIKTEIRIYSREINTTNIVAHYKSFYYAPQFTYKFCYYKNQTFTIHYDSWEHFQTESKYSHILGFGIMFGRQLCKKNLTADWYYGAGLRLRMMSVTIHEIYTQYPLPGRSDYPENTETSVSFYPFINLGLRIGFELK